jgi:hypothetical protein
VAILDTGVDADHPFLGDPSRVVAQACFSNAAGSGTGTSLCPNGETSQTTGAAADVEQSPECLDEGDQMCSHGTHVAGIAAGDGTGLSGAPARGVAPATDVIAIQVYTRRSGAACPGAGPCVLSYASDQIRGLERVLELQGSSADRIVAANLSLAGVSSATHCGNDPRRAAIDALEVAGIATTIAAGNAEETNAVAAPACIASAVAVGSTSDGDLPSNNRGPLLDLFAPGIGVDSSLPGDTFGSLSGTSMSAPHVAGAFAVIAEAFPEASDEGILHWLERSGAEVTYDSGQVTTPRIDLLAALDLAEQSPELTSDVSTVSVDEGEPATAAGGVIDAQPGSLPIEMGASAGEVTLDPPGWDWGLQTSDGPADSAPVTITATDSEGNDSIVTFPLAVANVAPEVALEPSQDALVAKREPLALEGAFEDPGYADTYTASVDWGDGEETDPAPVTMATEGPPLDVGEVSPTHAYERAGSYELTLEVSDDDGGTDAASLAVEVVGRCGGEVPTIVGTDASEPIAGTAGPDVIAGGRGADEIRGKAGRDVICGDNGDDSLAGGRGRDRCIDSVAATELASCELLGRP